MAYFFNRRVDGCLIVVRRHRAVSLSHIGRRWLRRHVVVQPSRSTVPTVTLVLRLLFVAVADHAGVTLAAAMNPAHAQSDGRTFLEVRLH